LNYLVDASPGGYTKVYPVTLPRRRAAATQAMIRASRQSILSDRADKPRFIKDTLPFLVAVTLVAATIIVPYSISSISLLGNGGSMLKRSRIDNIKYKSMGTVFSYGDTSTLPVPVQTKSPSSSDADNTASSTPVSPPSGIPSEEIVAEPALMLTPDRRASATASHGAAQGLSTVETARSELSAPQEASAQPASIANAASAAQHAAGVTAPTLAIFGEERDQIFRDFKVRRNGHTNLDQGSAAERVFGATSSRGAPPLRHATSHRQDPEADHKIIQKLNRLELSRLLKARERR